ncbi:hypothetical protein AVEN_102828-1 [Araneus ventricosus]|uniref:Uncharacterized protein n=1 Tax=Araneus ventricosus TaxID=182803 RepID=A0A4Y2X9K0_ARAVE|nr:hypothetical protein AVEN_102828-1 [Araneus ventricosus]
MFYNIFDTVPERLVGNTDNLYFVLYGGSLIHRVAWPKQETFGDVYTTYMSYIKRHYGAEVTVVFDGYTESSVNTKVIERQRRRMKRTSREIIFNESTVLLGLTSHLIQATFLFLRVAVQCNDELLSCSFNLSVS